MSQTDVDHRPTLMLKAWVAVPALFFAVTVSLYVPSTRSPGVPEMVAVPLPLSVNLSPPGRRPDSVIAAGG